MKNLKNDQNIYHWYDLLEEIGRGAHGKVYNGFDKIN
jgi:hypothetical protein